MRNTSTHRRIIYVLLVLLSAVVITGCLSMVSRVGEELHHCLTACNTSNAAHEGSIRMATFNMYHGYPAFENLEPRIILIAREINRQNLDIVFLQEMPWKKQVGLAADILKKKTQLNYVYIRANGNYSLIRFEEGIAIFSRFPLRDPKFTEIYPRPGNFENRAALAVIANTPHGPVNLVTTHLSWSKNPELNAAQVESLLNFVNTLEPHPTIIGGDFNALEGSKQIRALNFDWIDVYRRLNSAAPGETCCLDTERLAHINDSRFFARVDYIFLRKNTMVDWNIRESDLIFREPVELKGQLQWLSNHRGVYAEIDIGKRGREYTPEYSKHR